MNIGHLFGAVAIASLATVPAMAAPVSANTNVVSANPASSLSIAKVGRASTVSSKKSKLAGGGFIVAIIAAAAVVAGIVVVASDNSDSN